MLKIFSNFRSLEDPLYNRFKARCADKPITLFYDYVPQSIEDLQHNPYNFLLLHEPDEFFGMHTWAKNNYGYFTAILTWNEELLKVAPNAVLFNHNARNTSDEYVESFRNITNKKFEVSFLSGAKSIVEGHKLRQEIYKLGEQITIPKKWYHTLPDFNQDDFDKGGIGRPATAWEGKTVCYNEPMFHVAVENVKANNWYTEKIGEAFATKTLPIYWGCPNIGDFYDTRGIITFESKDELVDIVSNLTPELYYEMKPYIDHNYEVAFHDNFEYKLDKFFKELIELNDL
jgi:hypothetical protein